MRACLKHEIRSTCTCLNTKGRNKYKIIRTKSETVRPWDPGIIPACYFVLNIRISDLFRFSDFDIRIWLQPEAALGYGIPIVR